MPVIIFYIFLNYYFDTIRYKFKNNRVILNIIILNGQL